MKASIIGGTCLLIAAGSATVGASTSIDLDGNNRVLAGSDIFFPVVQQILSQTPAAHPGTTVPSPIESTDGTYFVGGGQGVGDTGLQANTQQISVGTASLANTRYCKNTGTGTAAGSIGWINADGQTTNGLNTGAGAAGRELDIQGTTQALVIGLDGLSILAGTQESGSAGTPNNLAIAGKQLIVRHYVPSAPGSKLYVVDPTTPPATAYGAAAVNPADPNTYIYTFNNSFDVIRLLWGGLHHGNSTNPADGANPPNNSVPGEIGTYDAGSDVRRSLADSWGSLFQGSVPNASAKLTHVWRRSDLAGATSAFVALVNFGSARGIGAVSGTNTRTNPFANAGDANGLNAITGVAVAGQSQVNSTVKSNGGVGDFADFDPIRRPALVGPRPDTGATDDLDQVAANDGTLGLVLTVFTPDTPGVALSQSYPTRFCTAGRFSLLPPGGGYIPTGPTGQTPCPQGGPYAAQCYQPYFLDTSVTPNVRRYNCLSKSTHPKAFGAPTPADNRVFNLVVKDDVDGHYIKDFNNRFLSRAAWFRIHTNRSNTLVTPGTPSSGLAIAQNPLSNKQQAALIGADPFSVSFNGRGDDQDPVLGGRVAAVGLSGPTPAFDPTLSVLPTDQHIKNLVIPAAGRPAADPFIYPLARRIYINSFVGFSENPPWSYPGAPGTPAFDPTAHAYVGGTWDTSVRPAVNTGGADQGPNTAVRGVQGQELALLRAFQNSDHVGASFLNFGFIPLPSAAEGFAANGIFALDYPEDAPTISPNLTDIPLNGCGQAAGQNRDSLAVSPPDAIVPYSLSGSSPPFPYPWP